MGYRLHSASKYNVKFGPHNSFGHLYAFDVNNVIQAVIPDAWGDANTIEDSAVIEINKESMQEGIYKLRQTKEAFLADQSVSNEYMANELQALLDQSDPDNDFIRLEWF